ncbi:hypothetical protein [Aureimonas populi]|uniref:Uncharacterized protein n=1 Tax=Aureimonas populi TaxID=1701758 RepID=A0ABW5CG72_9HYPH|nr:hypothetical protein [Aureimonas populi]
MNDKELWIGDRRVFEGDKVTTNDGFEVVVVRVDEQTGKVMLQPDTENPERWNEINEQLNTFDLPARIGAEMWVKLA